MRFSSYALAVLAIILVANLNVQPAWSLIGFNFTSGYGAGTTVEVWAIVYPSQVVSGPQDSGGEGALTASDSVMATLGGAQGRAEAIASAYLQEDGTLGALVSATWSQPLEASSGYARPTFYDTFTIVSDTTLSPGTPVSIALSWTLTGSFSTQTPGENPGQAQLFICAYPSPVTPPWYVYLVREYVADVVSSAWSEVDLDGTIDLSAAFQTVMGRPLGVGDSFVVEAVLNVKAGKPGFPPATNLGEFTSDFLSTPASLRPVSNTPGASIVSAAQQAYKPGGVPEFEAPTMLLVTVGLLALWALRRKPIRPTKT